MTFFKLVTIPSNRFFAKMGICKGGFKSEDVEGFSNLQKYIPFFYPKLSKTITSSIWQ